MKEPPCLGDPVVFGIIIINSISAHKDDYTCEVIVIGTNIVDFYILEDYIRA